MPSLLSCFCLLISLAVETSALTAVITGATGRTGSLTYKLLKSQGVSIRGTEAQGVSGCGIVQVSVRGVVHDNNVTNTKLILGCDKCDASEGIYTADITNATQLAPAMVNADSLIITVGCMSQCVVPIVGCHFLPGGPYADVLPARTHSVHTHLQVRDRKRSSSMVSRRKCRPSWMRAALLLRSAM